MSGYIQKQDVKTEAELIAAGATIASAIGTDQLYDITNTQKLSDAIAAGKPMTTSGDIIYRNGSVAARLPIGSATQVLTVSGGLPVWAASGGGGGGGASNTYTLSGILSEVLSDEADTFVPSADQLVDDFNDEAKGVKVNTFQANSALRLSTLNGTYERVKMVTNVMGVVDGAGIASAQAIAPMATALSPSSNSASVTFEFSKDLTNMFADTKKVVVVRKVIAGDVGYDGKIGYVAALATGGNVAELAVSGAPSYNSGLDKTTLVIANPDLIDLDFDLTAVDFPTKLRVIPWDYTYQVKSAVGSAYETMAIKNLSALSTVRIPGENFFTEDTTLTGSCLKQAQKMSPSGQHGIRVLLEKTAGNSVFRFYRSADYGKTWSEQASTKDSGEARLEEFDGVAAFREFHNDCVLVADNGKWVCVYPFLSTTRRVRGVYGDTSASTITDLPSTGTDGGNDAGEGSGSVFRHTTDNFYMNGGISGDLTDLNYIAMVGMKNTANEMYVRWYSNGGATHFGISASTSVATTSLAIANFVFGTSPNRRTFLVYRTTATDANYKYYDEGSVTQVGTGAFSSGPDERIIGYSHSGSTGYVLSGDAAQNYPPAITRIVMSGTPSIGSRKVLFSSTDLLNIDLFNGWNTENTANWIKNSRSRIAINPSDANHISIACDIKHPDAIRRSANAEIPDMTTVNFAGISQSTFDGAYDLNTGISNTLIGQTFTATASTPKLRTASFNCYQVGAIASGATLVADLYATAAGLPTGSSLGTSQTIDASLVTKNTSGQWLHFNFGNITLTNTVQYAVVITSSYTTSVSNYIYIRAKVSTNPYGGGTFIKQTSSLVWSLVALDDLMFMISDAYITNVGKGIEAGANRAAYGFHDQESQIQNINSTTAQLTFRRALNLVDADKQLTGHPYRRVMTWGTSGTQSTLSSSVVAGYAPSNFDENTVFSTSPGSSECASQNTTTGVLSTTEIANDRSGTNLKKNSYTGIVAGDYQADANFLSGNMLNLSTSGKYIKHGGADTSVDILDFYYNKQFSIEFEHKPTLTNTACSLSVGDQSGAVSNYGWYIRIETSGAVAFHLYDTGGTIRARNQTSAGFVVTNTYYRLKILCLGDGSAPKIYKATTSTGSFTEEVTYSSTVAFASGNSGANFPLTIGNDNSATFTPSSQKIGYIKINNGSSSYNFDGYKPQPPLVGHQNLGTKILAENKVGENSATSGTNFDNAGQISGEVAQASMVDSNDILVSFSHEIAGTEGNMLHFKWTGNRVSTRDVSALEAVNIRYTKS